MMSHSYYKQERHPSKMCSSSCRHLTHLGAAGLAVLGIAVIGRSIRIVCQVKELDFSATTMCWAFTDEDVVCTAHISRPDIPSRFISRHVRLQGHVKKVDDCSTLHTQHIPIIALGWQKAKPLPVTLSGVDVLGPGCTWLQRNLVGRQVWFEPVAVSDRNQLECIVTAKLGWFRKTCINKELVSRGMAFVRPLRDSVEDAHPVIRRLESSLMDAEIKAEKWGRGAWATPSLWSRFLHRPKATAGRAFRDNLILSSVGRLWKEAHLRLNKKMS